MGISRIALFYWGVSLSYLGTWKGNFCTAIYEEVAGVSRYSPYAVCFVAANCNERTGTTQKL